MRQSTFPIVRELKLESPIFVRHLIADEARVSRRVTVNGVVANGTVKFDRPLRAKAILEVMAVKGHEPAGFTDFTSSIMATKKKPELDAPVFFFRYVWRTGKDEYACLYLNNYGIPHMTSVDSDLIFENGFIFAIRYLMGHSLAA